MKLLAYDLIPDGLDAYFHYHKQFKYWTIEHDHDFYEIFLLTSGSIRHIVNGSAQIVRAGEMAFIRPTDSHSFEKLESEIPPELLNVTFRAGTVDEVLRFLGDGFRSERLLVPPLPRIVRLRAPDVQRILDAYERISSIPLDRKAEINTHARMLLAGVLHDHYGTTAALPIPDAPEWLHTLQIEMRNKERAAEGLPALYRLAPVTAEHLSRTIRKHMGMTPTEWINQVRLHHAAHSLRHSNVPIMSVCLEAGFSNMSHFYKWFKAAYSMSPGAYRKMNARLAIPE